MDAMQPSASVQDPSFLNLSSLSPLTFSHLALGLTRFHVLTTTLIYRLALVE